MMIKTGTMISVGLMLLTLAMTGFSEELTAQGRPTREFNREPSLENANGEGRSRALTVRGGKVNKKRIDPWEALEKGMTQSEVKRLLGPPGTERNGHMGATWFYPDPSGGLVWYGSNHRVGGWVEP